ncbi:MAG: HypC/HybG/HupF family hydrogenase formation chaperone [Candidatus Thiodiazotropha sp. 6PLUC1]
MCIGIPMQVVSCEGSYVLCEGMGESRRVDTLLVGDQQPGSWLLVFLDSAREVLSEQRADQIRQALLALDMALQGETEVGHMFADLVDREPQLPEHLRSKQ